MPLKLPNLREMFIPDSDHIMFEADLAGADAQVVAWEADDAALKRAFRERLDVHTQNARDLFDDKELHRATPKEVKANPRLNAFRQRAKIGVHATNYGCKERTLAAHLSISVREAENFQARWFSTHPPIAEWHRRTLRQLETTRTITNAFGYRRQYFDRVNDILPQALAWVPQSTVALAVNKGWVGLRRALPQVSVLLQVHDSVVGQFHKSELERDPQFPKRIVDAMTVTIPYDDPLIIPLSIKIGTKSWGSLREWSGDE